MHRLVLHNLGPVKDCDIPVNDFMVFTGPQATGKSTIAKAIYYFRAVKVEIINSISAKSGNITSEMWHSQLEDALANKFLRLFSSFIAMQDDFCATYYYDKETYISINRPSSGNAGKKIQIEFSSPIQKYFSSLFSRVYNSSVSNFGAPVPPPVINTLFNNQTPHEQERLNELLQDSYSSIFIPAGRSLITLLSGQLNALFASMNDYQRFGVDYCTQLYAGLIQSLQPSFYRGTGGVLFDSKTFGTHISTELPVKAQKMAEEILKGRYSYSQGMEWLSVGQDENQFVPMHQTSSGQQEALWITNILVYYLAWNVHTFLIVEEPESNLYPDTQKKMTELLSLFHNAGNQVLITTHSPYVLGTLNNLIYASDIHARGVEGVENIIDRECWLNRNSVSAWHMDMEVGSPKPATEPDLGLIRNEYIDGASIDLTEESDSLYELYAKEDAL